MSLTSELHISTKSPKIQNLWQTALSEGLPIALWRLPKTAEKQLIIDLSGRATRTKLI